MGKEVKQYTPSEVLEIMGNELYEIRILTKFPKSIYTKNNSQYGSPDRKSVV